MSFSIYEFVIIICHLVWHYLLWNNRAARDTNPSPVCCRKVRILEFIMAMHSVYEVVWLGSCR